MGDAAPLGGLSVEGFLERHWQKEALLVRSALPVAELKIPADLFHAEQNAVQLLALSAFRAIDCAGMARVDLFVTPEHEVYLNEVNTIPGFTAISMYPQLWKASGLDADELVTTLIELAFERQARRVMLRTSASEVATAPSE